MLRKYCLIVQCGLQSGGGVDGTGWGEWGLICITVFRNFALLSAAQVVLHTTQRASGEIVEFITKYPGHKDKDST